MKFDETIRRALDQMDGGPFGIGGTLNPFRIARVTRRHDCGYTVENILNVRSTPNGLEVEIEGKRDTFEKPKFVTVTGVVTSGLGTVILTSEQVEKAYAQLQQPVLPNLTRVRAKDNPGRKGVVITGPVQKRYAKTYNYPADHVYTVVDDKGEGCTYQTAADLLKGWEEDQ